MKITKKYIRRLPDVLKALPGDETLVPILRDPADHVRRLTLAGFTEELRPGETLIPDARLGPKARFNANGRWIRHKDQPMERCYRVIEWTYYQWHGKERVAVTDWTEVSYYRYPRTLVPPPSMALKVAVNGGGHKVVVAPSFTNRNEEALINSINLVLSVAGECEIVNEAGEAILTSPEIQLDWELFPAGAYPWDSVVPSLHRVISRERPGTRPLIWKRLEAIEKHRPSFRAVGRAGYTGYLVFGFEELDLYICESTRADNATYVFRQGWEEFTRLTKAEVIGEKLATGRLVHRRNWFDQIENLFPRSKAA